MECNDKNCPTHGKIKIRGMLLEGVVVSTKMKDSVVVERHFLQKDKKYERLKRAKSRVSAHKPQCMEVKMGDRVELGETRKISKTKNFVVTKVIEGKK